MGIMALVSSAILLISRQTNITVNFPYQYYCPDLPKEAFPDLSFSGLARVLATSFQYICGEIFLPVIGLEESSCPGSLRGELLLAPATASTSVSLIILTGNVSISYGTV